MPAFCLQRYHPAVIIAPARLLLAAFCACLFAVSCPAFAVVAPQRNAAVDLAADLGAVGRLRMQAQRVAKLYLQGGLAIDAERSRRQLAAAVRQGDADLEALSRRVADGRTRKALARVGVQWRELKAALLLPWGGEAVQRINALAESQSIMAGRLALLIEEDAVSADGRLLDLAMRQGMLAQRLARLYLLAQAGDDSRGRLVDVEQTRREFAGALEELSVVPDTSVAVREALALVRMQWLFFDRAVGDPARGERGNPQHVASTSERLSEVLDVVVQQLADGLASAPAASSTRRRAGG